MSALALLLAVAYGAHLVYELLRPLLPYALGGAVVVFVGLAVNRRRRW